jgi:signal transduction histidine kinase/DNA-binding NarL/FixJ family response regulator
MNLYNTNMHLSVFVFIMAELLILFYLCIHYLYQPKDKNRLYLIVLLLLVLAYNVIGGTFPDARLPISLANQNKIEYGSGFLMCCFVPYYFFKVYKLDSIRWHISYGVLFCFVLPYVLCFLILYPMLPDWEIIRKIGVVIPFVYSLVFVYQLGTAIYEKHKARQLSGQREIVWIFLAVAPWVSLCVTSYFAAPDYVEYPLTNTGFLVVLFLFIRNHIHDQRAQDESLKNANGMLAALNDQLQRSNTELEEKVAGRTRELQTLNEKRMNTFSNLAHEMKTPLTLLKDYMHGLALQYPDAEPIHFAKKHVNKLSRDVVNLFDLLRSEKGIHQYDHQHDTNFSIVVHERILLFQASAHRRRISITHQIEPNLAVQANQTALERVVNNLIDNAIKYSPEGTTIHITLTVASESELVFSITDQGLGIEPQHQQLIFEPYERISHTHSHGMGMGMPIIKTILDQIGGSVQVISNPDQKPGTTFVIRLPYQPQVSAFFDLFLTGHEHLLAPQPPTLPKLLSDEYAPASYLTFRPHEFVYNPDKKTLLVVEDNPEMMQYLIDYLSPLYNTYYAFDGLQAIEKLKAMPEPDLIISDVMMPRMDGLAFRRNLIASDSKYLSIPFLFLSAKSEEKMKGLHLKADFIEKPFEIHELLAKVSTLIALRDNNREQTREQMINSIFHFKQNQQLATEQGINQKGSTQESKAQGGNQPEIQEGFSFEKNLESFIRSHNIEITSRERDLILLFPTGQANKQIAAVFNIAEPTVSRHISNIFQKFAVNSKLELINQVMNHKH